MKIMCLNCYELIYVALKLAGKSISTRTHTCEDPYLWPIQVTKARAIP